MVTTTDRYLTEILHSRDGVKYFVWGEHKNKKQNIKSMKLVTYPKIQS